MLKSFVINPWMFDAAQRLQKWVSQHQLPLPSSHQWGFLEGFRRAEQDVDRHPGNWVETWHEIIQKNYHRALDQYQSKPIGMSGIDFEHFDLLRESGKISLLDYAPDAISGLDKRLSSQLIESKDRQQQVWIKLASHEFPSPLALQASLRLGASWWCQPPEQRSDWDQFIEQQEKWSEIILKNPQWDQWVWPWGQFIEQGLRLSALHQKPSAQKFTFPEGWQDRKNAAWGNLGMKIWASAQKNSENIWEDRWIGILSRLPLRSSPTLRE